MEDRDERMCRLCWCTIEEDENEFISPCSCKGTIQYVHASCFEESLQAKLQLQNERRPQPGDWQLISKCDTCCSKFKVAPHIFYDLPEELQVKLDPPFDPCYIASRIHGAFRVCVAVNGLWSILTTWANGEQRVEQIGHDVGFAMGRKWGVCGVLALSPLAGFLSIFPCFRSIKEEIHDTWEAASLGISMDLLVTTMACLLTALRSISPDLPQAGEPEDALSYSPILYAFYGSIVHLIRDTQRWKQTRLPTLVHCARLLLCCLAREAVAEACDEGVYFWLIKQVKVVMRGLWWIGRKIRRFAARLIRFGRRKSSLLHQQVMCKVRELVHVS